MEELSNAIKDTSINNEHREQHFQNIEEYFNLIDTYENMVYKLFRNLCPLGKAAQDKILSMITPISSEKSESSEYLELLYNLCVNNKDSCLELSDQMNNFKLSQSKYILMILYMILLNTNSEFVLSKHSSIISAYMSNVSSLDDDSLEWALYILVIVLPDNLSKLLSLIEHSDDFLSFVASCLESTYDKRLPVIAGEHKDLYLTHQDFYNVCTLKTFNKSSILIVNICLRNPTTELQRIFLTSGASSAFWNLLSSSSVSPDYQVLVLQTLANSIKDFYDGAQASQAHLLETLNRKVLNFREPLCKEWTQLLVQWMGELNTSLGPELKLLIDKNRQNID